MEASRKGRAKASGREWWRILVEVVTVIAVPSALLYVLGVLAFWLRIASEYDNVSIGTTWYAASLVPRSMAAASELEVIGRGFTYGALISFVVLFVVHIVAYARLKRGSREEDVRFFSAPLLVPLLFLLVAGLVSVLLNVLLSGGSSYGLLSNLRVVAVILLILSLVVIYPLVFGTTNESRSLQSMLHSYSRPVYWAITAVLIVRRVRVHLIAARGESFLPVERRSEG